MRSLVLALLAACGGEKQSAPAPGSASAQPVEAITAQLAGCGPALAPPADPREPVPPERRDPFGMRGPSSSGVRVIMQTPSVTGALDPEIVRRYVRRHTPKLRVCYEAQLATAPALGGAIEASFAINPSGHVTSATAGGVDRAVAACFARHIKNVAFPPPRDGNNVQVTLRFDLQNPNAADLSARPARVLREWTPFAAAPGSADARLAATETAAKLRERMPAVEHCFDGARGAVRAVLAIDGRGTVSGVRAGGLGDSAIESCVARALDGLSVTPPASLVEIACDITRGGEAPLRVSPDAGYTVIELSATEVKTRSSVRDIPPRGSHRGVTMLGGAATVLVVADPDAPAHGLEYALWWAPPGPTLVAVKASGGAPVLLGTGDSRARRIATTEQRVVQLRTDRGELVACLPGSDLPDRAALLDPRAMDRVMQAVVAACARSPCEPTVVVGTTGDFVAKDLVATTSAARRAGLHSISIGGPACDP